MDYIAFIVLVGIIFYQFFINWVDRRDSKKTISDLYNRLMARNFGEYIEGTSRLAKKPDAPMTAEERELRLGAILEDKDYIPV